MNTPFTVGQFLDVFRNYNTSVFPMQFVFYILCIIGIFLAVKKRAFKTIISMGLPCPTTIFTLGKFLLSDKKFPSGVLIIPVIWSVIGFIAALNFGIKEDIGLLIAGILFPIIIFIKNKKIVSFKN